MPVQAHIQIVELPVQQHVNFADDCFFGRCSVKADGPFQLVLFHRLLDRQDGA